MKEDDLLELLSPVKQQLEEWTRLILIEFPVSECLP